MTASTAAPRFTVVIPALDEADHLPFTLESIRRQDFSGGVEVIVVDNGSRDETAQIARHWGARVIDEPVPGVCVARQRGSSIARGDIVVSTDADTSHPAGWLTRFDAQFRSRPDAVAVAGPCIYEEPPWWAAAVPPLWFAAIGLVYHRTGRVAYLTATNVAYLRDGFPGYNTLLTQGGDEADLLRRLRAWGTVVWDSENVVITSSRRLDQGLAYTLLVSYGYYYATSMWLGRLLSRQVIGVAPVIRLGDRDRTQRRRRRWRVMSTAMLSAMVIYGMRHHTARSAPVRRARRC